MKWTIHTDTTRTALSRKMAATHLTALGLLILGLSLQCKTAVADQVLLSCNFENDCQNELVQEWRNDEINFELGSGWQGEWSTGPEADHTFGNLTGKYYFINANGANVQKNDRAVLHLPETDSGRFREGRAQLSLAYHMYDGYGASNQMGTLNVYLDCGGVRNVTWAAVGNQGDDWKTTVIPLECDGMPAQVSIEAVRNGVLSDIAIDDVRFVDFFEGSLIPATRSTATSIPSSSRNTPSPARGGDSSSTTLHTNPRNGGTSGQTMSPAGTGGITTPPGGGSGRGLGLDIIVPIAAAALVALVLIIVLVLVLLIHRQRKMKKTSGDTMEPPSQLYENNIFSDTSPSRKYESLQGPLSNSDRIYEELNSKKSTLEMPNNTGGAPTHPQPHQPHQQHHRPHQQQQRYHQQPQPQQPRGTAGYPTAQARSNGHVPLAVRRSMPELGDNFYDRINDRVTGTTAIEPSAPPATMTRNPQLHPNARSDNNHNSYLDRSHTYHPSRTSYPEDHPYFTLMPDVVSSSTAFPDDRILFTIPPPPSSSPPPLPPAPRDYDYGRPYAANLPTEDEELSDLNEYHHVLDVDKRRPLSMNSNFEDDDEFGRPRMALDMMAARGYEMGSDLRLSRDTDISGRLDLDYEADMRMSAEGEADVHNMETIEMPRGREPGRDRRSRDMELEHNLDQPRRPYGVSGMGTGDRRRNIVVDGEENAEDIKDYHSNHSNYSNPSNYSNHSDRSPYHHVEEDPQGHIRMVNLNYSPSVVHV